MYLSASELEGTLLKRLEYLRSTGYAALGLPRCLASTIQAESSASGLEWSSSDGHEEGQELVKVEVQDTDLARQLEAWQAWLAAGAAVDMPRYYAFVTALIQDILAAVPVGGEHAVPPAALSAAWEEDAAGEATVPPERLTSSLAALATVCCSDASPGAAAACLGSLLERLKGQGERWQRLLEQYSSAGQIGAAAGPAAAASRSIADDGADGGEQPDVAPASDKSPAAAAASAAGAAVDGDAGADDDASSSLGLSRASSAANERPAEPDAEPSIAPAARAARGVSTKSLGDPDLARKLSQALSGASSADLGDLPDNLDALEQQQQPLSDRAPKAATRPSIFASTMASEEGKGHLAGMPMDLKQWATFKDKDKGAPGRPPAGPTAPRGAARPHAGVAPLVPLNGAGGKAADQQAKAGEPAQPPLLAARTDGPKANPLHNAIVNSSAVRQSADREQVARQDTKTRVSRVSSNDSAGAPARQRSIAGRRANLSRKPSISEPGPTGSQAEWKHQLPQLGQASRLHPAELRQHSHGQLRPEAASVPGGKGVSPTVSSTVLVEDKLPSLPSLAGARGQPPKGAEMLRKPSLITRSDVSRSDNHHAPNAHLPGLGERKPPGACRALRMPSKKSFRGDRDF